jgi:hypothetical protein
MMKLRLGAALVAAGVIAGGFATNASAADLGGNCCADLEERIAELEATTARKGNRKVSLTVSGWVGQQVMFWDDGREQNAYVSDLGTTLGSHVKFTGQATIMPGWTAGYVLHLEAIGSDSLTISQDQPRGPAALTGQERSVQTLQSFWFVKSDQLGKVSVGTQSDAADNAAILVDGSGSLVPANWVAFDVNSFFIRQRDGTLSGLHWGGAYCQSYGGAWGDCNGIPRNVVRYDSPTFAGFSGSASWGEDDSWAVTGRYAGEWNSIKVSAVASYSESTDEGFNQAGGVVFNGNTQQYFQAGLYVEHVPTGLFAMANYGHDDYADDSNGVVGFAPGADLGSSQTWYAKAGIRQRWNPLGHTVLYGEYLRARGNGAFSQSELSGLDATHDATRVWGVGIVQEIDAAAMSMWIKYRNLDYSDNSGIQYDNFNEVAVGALINF